VKAVPWETAISEGGTGRTDYDGVGVYRTRFHVPKEYENESLAFYSDGIDDADETFLNDKPIGHTGSIPKYPNKSLKDFRAAPREARLYPLSNLNFGEENEIKIKLYDYAGLGGLSPKQTPVIGKFHILQEREKNHRLLNDLPRTIGWSFLLIFLFSYLFHYVQLIPTVNQLDVVKSIFHPYRFYFRKIKNDKPEYSIETFIAARYLLSALFCFFSLFFLFTELTYKYLLIESEEFYFKIPTLGFALGQFTLQLLFYPDVFGSGISKKGTRLTYTLRILLSILTYPFWTILFFIYLLCLPPNEVWSEFTVKGVANLFFVITLLFAGSTINLLQVGYSKSPLQDKDTLLVQGFARASLLIGMLFSTLIWFFSPTLYPFSFLIMILFLMGYMLISLGFIVKNRIILPIESVETFPIFTIVQKKYGITYSEAEIVEAIYNGLSRMEIKIKIGIKEDNLKKYLSSIYKKVFKYHKDVGTSGRDKLQRLTMILHSMIDRSKPDG
jgi:hypothetical protein